MQLAHVHGGHGQTGAVDHAADVAIQRHIVQADFVGDMLALIFLAGIAHFGGVLVPIERVVIEADLGVERHHLAVVGHDQRVDLDHAAVFLHEQVVDTADDLDQLIDLLLGHAHAEAQVTGLVGLHAGSRIDGEGQDLLGSLGGDLFDIHAAFGRANQDNALLAAVDQAAQIVFLGDIDAVLDQQGVDRHTFGTGLVGDQGRTEQTAGELLDVLQGTDKLHTTGLAAAAGMDLGLNNPRTAQFLGGFHRLLLRGHLDALGHRHAELL